ncbi:MAG: hypothetical protein ACMXX8_03600, partial [Candidatus Woesearchaeota archaeon]
MDLKNKKGFFFTSIAVLVLSITLLLIKPIPSQIDVERIQIIEKRIEDMNYLVKEIGKDYIPKAILSASRNGLREYSNNITS